MSTALSRPQAPRIGTLRLPVLVNIGIGFGLIEVALWCPKHIQLWVSLAAASWIIGSTALSGRSADELGLGRRGLRESAWVAAAALTLAALIVLIGWLFGWLHPLFGPVPSLTHAIAYAVWAFQQEFILQSFLFLGLTRVITPRRAVMIAAALFSIAHLPNPILVAATLLSGLALTTAFARYGNVYPLAIAHAALGLAVAISIPADIHRNMRVGIGYLKYKPAQTSQLAPNSGAASTIQAISPTQR